MPVVVLSVVLGAVLLAGEPSGTDLAAAVAHGDFARSHPLTPVDLRWYGGTNQFGYSLISQHVVALLGARPAGVLAASVSAVAFGRLLVLHAVARPLAGALVGCLFFFGNLVSGRIAWSLGVAAWLLCLLALGRRSVLPAVALAAAAGAASPVAGLFLGTAAAVLVMTGRHREGVAVGAASALPLLVSGLLFGEGGWMQFGPAELRPALVLSAAVMLLVPHRAVRLGAALSAAGVLAAFMFETPVGLNVCRLAMMFAVPLIVATCRTPAAAMLALSVGLLHYQPPLAVGDWRNRGDTSAEAGYYEPLLAELRRLGPTGRVEVPPLANYWDSVHVAREQHLARGWLRQADTARNPLFFDGTLDPSTYRAWLQDNGVQYVAVANTRGSWVGARETDIVRQGQPYLTAVWSNADWTLHRVQDPNGLVSGATLLSADAASLSIRVDTPGTALVRVGHSRWLTIDGPGAACIGPAVDGWATVRTAQAGTYRVGSSLLGGRRC